MIKRKENKKENKMHSALLPHVSEPLMLRETFAGGRPVVWQLVSVVQAGDVEQPNCLAKCLSGGNLFVTQCDAGEQKSIPHSSQVVRRGTSLADSSAVRALRMR